MISVLLPTYNGEKFLREQIDSILLCLSDHDELLVRDDNSSDKTKGILTSYSDSRIKLLLSNENIGLVKSIDNLLSLAKGDFIFLSDQDDIWLPNRISSVMPYFQNYDIVVSDCIVVDSSLRTIKKSYFDQINPRTGLFFNLIRCRYLGCCMGFKRAVLEAVTTFPEKVPSHDLWIGIISNLIGYSTCFLSEPAIFYRRHTGALSVTFSNKQRALHRRFIDRVSLFISLIAYLPKICSFRFIPLRK
jgi:glycosyltransferase involved in cell wall biosynthesis